jgi:hypothetical protein
MGSSPSRHHIQNLTTYRIYVRYDKYDVVTTERSGGGKLKLGGGDQQVAGGKQGMSGEISGHGSTKQTLKDRPAGFNLIRPGMTDEHICDVGAMLSVIVAKDGTGHLVINNQQLEKDRSYGLDSSGGGRLFKKVHGSDKHDKDTVEWDFDNPIAIHDWQN